MFDSAFRAAAGVAAMPARWVSFGMHRLATGSHAVVEVVVTPQSELMDRQALIEQLTRMAHDPAVAGVVFRFDGSPGGWAAATDLRASIELLSRCRKPTVALLENPGNVEMWLGTACDHVFLVPTGQVNAIGVGAQLTFFAEALSRVGVVPDIEAAGEFKAAGEPMTRRFASAANRTATKALIDGIHHRLIEGIAESRELSLDVVSEAIARAPLSAAEALDVGLVDALKYPDQLGEWLDDEFGSRCGRIALARWTRWSGVEERLSNVATNEHVAIVHLQGPIVLEEQPGAVSIAARTVVGLLAGLREASNIRGVVLHVNSPGGGAYASDLIWREVERLVREKPVVACFEDVSASGGYYLSAPASHIVARPTTITGSIGVVGGKPVAAEALRKLGVHVETIAASPNATMFSPTAAFTDAQRERFRASLQVMYDGFVQRVAGGRRRHVDLIEPHCRGRVWLGAEAAKIGLVDQLGNVDVAVAQVEKLTSKSLSRIHISGHLRPSWMSRQAQKVVRDALPIGVRAIGGPALSALGPASTAWLMCPGQPLALWPYDLVVR